MDAPSLSREDAHFREAAEVDSLLDVLEAAVEKEVAAAAAAGSAEGSGEAAAGDAADSGELSAAVERLQEILNKYQEQATLLDPSLARLVERLGGCGVQLLPSLAPEGSAFPFQLTPHAHVLQGVSEVLYTLVKVRGAATVVKLFPHEVHLLEPVLFLLQCQDAGAGRHWQTHYMLLLWLSILVLLPFDLTTIDSAATDGAAEEEQLIPRIVNLARDYLADSGAPRDAAATCIAKLLTRPDMDNAQLAAFLTWADARLRSEDSSAFETTGVLNALAQIFKHGHRAQLLTALPRVYPTLLVLARDAAASGSSPLTRKLVVKLAARLGLTYLPPRVPKWRYQRGQRSLLSNLRLAGGEEDGKREEEEKEEEAKGEEAAAADDADDDDDDDDIDVPEEVEELLDILLTGLRDSDTIVRWSAAKGVGRLTGRLPRLLADDVVLSVLELLDDAEGEGAWHGGCLALAELARRGLLLPARLPQVVPVVRRALVYDVRKGSHSVGADVRDAACYVCWAFARAYAPAVMAPFVRTLSQGMLVTAVFDRQVNCRRAASAAFQENVGRQGHGNFPNGISILTAADYFTLGNRVKAYTEISVYIAQFPAYRTALLEHLLDAKLCHWDVALRQLAAQTLHNMAPLAPGWMVDVALPTLVPATLSTDLLLRHGATLAVAELLRALAKIPVQLPADLMKAVRNIVPRVEKARLYRGRGGHLMRAAVCRLIECLALAGHALSRRAVLRYWKSLDETMKHPDEEIKAAAVAALRALSRAHTSYVDDALVDRVVRSYVKTLRTDDNPGARRGFTLALGALAPQLLLESSDALASAVDVLTHCAIKDEDAETRRNALQALREMALALHVRRPSGRCLTAEQGCAIFDAMLAALNDYATDDRGDVGSWSRVAAMQGIAALAVDYCRLPPEGDSRPRRVSTPWGEADVVEERVEGALLVVDYQPPALGASYFPYQRATIHSELAKPLSSSTAEEFMLPALEERAAVALVDGASEAALASIRDTLPAAHFLERPFLPRPPILGAERTRAAVAGLMKQLAERADNVRGVAGRCLMAVLHSSDPTVRPVPELDRLRRMFKPSDDMNWTTAADTFPLIVRVLDLPAYQTEVALGLSISVGGLTESVVKAASAALTAWTKARVKKRNLRSLAQLVRAMLSFFDSHRGSKRIQVALLKTVKLLMDAGALTVLAEPSSDFLLPLLTAVKASVRGCKDTARLHASIGVFLAFLDYAEDVRNSALLALLALLGHRYPTLRKAVAHQLYLALLAREGELIEGEEAYEDVLDVLTETAWDGAADEARAKRDELYAQFGLEKPAVVERRPRPAAAAGADEDELESYAALVKEMGY